MVTLSWVTHPSPCARWKGGGEKAKGAGEEEARPVGWGRGAGTVVGYQGARMSAFQPLKTAQPGFRDSPLSYVLNALSEAGSH